MNDRIRISDADRDRVTARLRDHFAEGRLDADELDERLTAALNAKTVGDLRGVMTDLPEPGTGFASGPGAIPVRTGQLQGRPTGYPVRFRRGPRIFPLVALAVLLAVLVPGARWLLFGFVQAMFVVALAVFVAGAVMLARFRGRMRREWWAAYNRNWPGDWRSGGWAHQRR
jgi:hypothetical protein